MSTKTKILYFASIREKVAKSEEKILVPSEIKTVGGLLKWMKTRGPQYNNAFGKHKSIQVAVDQVHVSHSAKLKKGAKEIAIFPPMTGG